ncbi:MAG: YbaB/EbfC family nucleoid-associated protein [Anaerolineae bacterium]|nr:YbaB/EbfC family nucleoid-associated protein [Anaerolineae bacterium]
MAKRRGKGKGFSLGGGGMNMPGGMKGGLAGQLQAMQQQMMESQEALGEKTVEASAGGGVVTVVMTGHYKLQSITIDPEVVDPEDVDMLQDLIMAAVNEAVEAVQNLTADEMSAFTGGLNIPGLF